MSASANTKATSVAKTPTKKKEDTVPTNQTKKEAVMPTTEHPLSHLIPSRDWYENEDGEPTYISRTIAGVRDLDAISASHRLRHNLILAGPTGSAKTSVTYAYGAWKQLPVINIPCNGAAEPSMFIGKWVRLQDGSFDFKLGELALAVLHGGIILLDEVNFLKSNIGAYLHGLLDSRRTLSIPDAQGSSAPTSIKAHPDCFIVGAYNPDYHGTRPLNQAFKNRFQVQIDFPYLTEVEDQLLQSESLLTLANNLRLEVQAGNLSTPISTNMLIECEELAMDEALGFDFAMVNFLNHFPEDERQPVKEVLVQVAPLIHAELFDDDYPLDGMFNPSVPSQSTQPQY